jgi:hypothetical protein
MKAIHRRQSGTRFFAGPQGVIPIRSARYKRASDSVMLRPARRLSPRQKYKLTVIGTPHAGLSTTVGAYLAGAGSGESGTDYVATIPNVSRVPAAQREL